jgi:NTE family protein
MNVNIKNVVFSSGSIGGLSFVGAWRALEEHNIANNLVGFSGCSIGAVMALLTSIGYTGRELHKLAYALDYDKISDLKILNMFDNLGLDTGDSIQELLEQLLQRKTGKTDLTFMEHYCITGRKLWINASCVTEDKCYYFSADTYPDISIITAVRMSMAFPIMISAVKYDNKIFIDGAFHDPCPVNMFPVNNTIVFEICNKSTNKIDLHEQPESNFFQYTCMLMSSMIARMYHHLSDALDQYSVLILHTGLDGVAFKVSKTVRKRLVKLGYEKTHEWLNSLKINV